MATYSGTSGNDSIIGSQGDDTIHRLGGKDTILGDAGNDLIDLNLTEWDWIGDSIDGGAGNDTLYGSGGVDTLLGSDGNDEIFPYQDLVTPTYNGAGDSDNNVLDGGKGNDTIHSGFTDSIIYFRRGDGQDSVTTRWGEALNTVEFKDSTKFSDLVIKHQDNDLVIAIKNTTDQITFKNFYDQHTLVGHLTFQDGTSVDLNQFLLPAADKQTQGTAANDTLTGRTNFEFVDGLSGDDKLIAGSNLIGQVLYGGAGNDTLDGGHTRSILIGGLGNDTYVIDGTQTIMENAGEGQDAVITWGPYISLPDNIETGVMGDTPNSFGMSDNVLNNLLEGNNYNNQINAYNGNDTLRGHAGADTLTAWGGGDTYIFGLGDGQDVLVANYTSSVRPNTLQITGASDLAERITGERVGQDLVLSIANTTDTLTLRSFFANGTVYNASNPVQSVYFPETGITWNIDTLAALANRSDVFGSDEDDRLSGTTGADHLYGYAGNDTLDGGTGADQMAGGSGNDRYLVDDVDDVVIEDPDGGVDLVVSTIDFTAPANVENVTLSTDEVNRQITGNALNNVLTGNWGSDTLDGGAGDDTLDGGGNMDWMKGGTGNDTYIIDDSGDEILEEANGGTDLIMSSVDFFAPQNVESLTLVGEAYAAYGNELANMLTGNSQDNLLEGGAGNDTLRGGGGNDTYVFNTGDGEDVILAEMDDDPNRLGTLTIYGPEDLPSRVKGVQIGNDLKLIITGPSLDTVTINGFFSSDGSNPVQEVFFANTDLVWDVIKLKSLVINERTGTAGNDTMTGTSGDDRYFGLAGNDNLSGHDGNDFLGGDAGNDLLDGGAGKDTLDGGAGNDKMSGGQGDDLYIVDTAADSVTEKTGEGLDLIQSSVSYTTPVNVENLTLTGSANINATGNALANVLTGNAGNNMLDGAAGADFLVGGAGNDTYTVDVAGDVVFEAADQGTDTILSAVTYTASANVENLTLTGSAAINATGNALANTLTGNGGNNVLDGGTGNDAMSGGKGNDTYVVDSTGDVVTEGSGMGTDLILASVSYTASANVENLTLTGSAAINATGNALVNVLTGNSAANVLDGGAGADKLIGGAGNDTYVVDIAGDAITELDGQGTDLILSAVTYTVSAFVENLTLTGSAANKATGNTLDNVLTGNSGNNALDGAAGNDTLDGGAGNDTLTGGVGADFLTGGTGSDQFVFAAGSTVLTIGGSGNAGTLAGYDRIGDFALGFVTGAQDKIDTIGTPAIVANTALSGVNGKDSALTIADQTVKSHAIKDGMITFDDTDTYGAALNLDSLSDVAAVVQYLQANNLGKAGASVAFDADTGGIHHTFLFTQGDATRANNALDVLVDLVGVDASRLAAATAGMTATTLLIG